MGALRDPSLPPRRRRPDVVAERAQLQRIHAAAQQVASDVKTVEENAVSPAALDTAVSSAIADVDLTAANSDLAARLDAIGNRLDDLET